MNQAKMTSLERVLTTLQHKEPDRAPFFLLLTMHGAKELGMSIEQYFSCPEHVAEGQLRMRAKYQHDCLYTFHYASIEIEAWGGNTIYCSDGPPNSGDPIIQQPDQIQNLTPPDIKASQSLRRVLKTTALLKAHVSNDVPIIGVVMSPFSLPVMQMGFGPYLELIHEQPALFERLMAVNETFCVEWANEQLAAGATAICYFDPVSSSTIIPPELYLKTGFRVAQRTLPRFNGPTAIHMASGRCLSIIDDLVQTGPAVLGVSVDEDLGLLKTACAGKVTLLGNINGIELCRYTKEQTEAAVKQCLAKAGVGGGFILSDNHGEIPWQVTDSTLMALSEAVHQWGSYPLTWAVE